MPTLQCGDRSLDCDRGELLRDEFIDERTDREFGPGREVGGGYGVSAVAFGRRGSSRPWEDGSGAVAPSDGGERDDRGHDGPQRWTPSPSEGDG
ncbi:hypothetical protein [Halosimplex halophilum]|uniref:hypothetical protein n=1 Tax=Halosimplex halophilum TaxID=2559572 RepID=UPI00107EF20B|nr:hypothetical protein [Halosimplex halophilum]